MPEISVIVPVYNVKKYLEDCLESLARQSVTDCEFICIDDGSTDDSSQVIEKYVKNDPRFIGIRQENKGVAETRNVGLRKAGGKYVAFLDADDMFASDCVLERLYQRAEEGKLDIVSFETELFYEGPMKETDNKDFYYYKRHSYPGIRKGWEFLADMMEHREYCDSACLLLVRREWLFEQNILFYSGILYEDALFCMQCFLSAERMAHLPEKFYWYRIREKSIMTSQVYWENVRSRLVVYREILCLLVRLEGADSRLQRAVAEYLSQLAFHAKYLDEFRLDEPSEEETDPLDEVFLKSMELGKYRREVNENVLLAGLQKLAEESEGLVLYGAGKIGRMLAKFLNDKGLSSKILCYAVTRAPQEPAELQGIPVCSIAEAVKKSGRIILSVIDNDAQQEMRGMLAKLGIYKFEIFDPYLYRALRHYMDSAEEAVYGTGM